MRGKPKGGWVEAQARILDAPEEEAKMRRRLAAKYGLMYRLFGLMARLRGAATGILCWRSAQPEQLPGGAEATGG